MSEMLTINTDLAVQETTSAIIEPLSVYDDNHAMLRHAVPECKDAIPNPLMSNLVSRLKMTMKLYGGIGLAANQCGVMERVFVIGTDQFQMACINPKIILSSENKIRDNEGCLSYPGLSLKVERSETISVEYTSENGETRQVQLSGLTARCFQHELDHLNGIRFVEHVGSVSLKLAKQKQFKLIKKHMRNKKNGL